MYGDLILLIYLNFQWFFAFGISRYPSFSAHEPLKSKPLGCGCLNGGVCTLNSSDILRCECYEGYSGELCETYVARSYISREPWSPATVIIPIVLIILVLGALAALYVFFNRRHLWVSSYHPINHFIMF